MIRSRRLRRSGTSDAVPRRPRFALAFALALPAAPAAAQGNMEIQVYGADLVPPAATMFELHSNFTFSGASAWVDGVRPTEHALHETVEITHGFTPWLEVGFYTFTSMQPDGTPFLVGNHIRPRLAIPAAWHWPVGLSLSQEIGWQRADFDPARWSWEIRPIVDKQAGRLYVSVNPALERALRGPGTADGMHFAPNAVVTWDGTPKITPGLEYYGDFGPVTHFAPVREQQQMLAPVVNLNFGADWEFNLGPVYSLTPASDRLLVKMIVGRRVGGRR